MSEDVRGRFKTITISAREWDEFIALRGERAALLCDKERLDWLERQHGNVVANGGEWEVFRMVDLVDLSEAAPPFPTLRDALDAAMREETP